MRKFIPLILSCTAYAAESCTPQAPAPCTPDKCEPTYCLGPANLQGNSPVRPYTCDGDFVLTASALYWKANQDGLEFGIFEEHQAFFSVMNQAFSTLPIISGEYLRPRPKCTWGFKLGIEYDSPVDGWDLGISWTTYNGIQTNDRVEPASGNSMWAFWSADLAISPGPLPFGESTSQWEVQLMDIPVELGREFWVSRFLTLRPLLGISYISLDQNYQLSFSGGAWNENLSPPGVTDWVILKSKFHGIGPFAGIDTNWHFGCGWSIYGDFSAAIVYGRFSVDHTENTREAASPFYKKQVLKTSDRFRASRPMCNFGIGVEYSALVSDSKYEIKAQLGWEQHLYFHQNQMWRVTRNMGVIKFNLPNQTGENVFTQSRGTLSVGGLTLKLAFAF